MATSHWCLIAAEQTVLREWETPKSHSDGPQEGTQAMDYHTPEGASFLLLSQFDIRQERTVPVHNKPRVALWIRERGTAEWWPVYDPGYPLPPPSPDDDAEFGPSTVGVLARTPSSKSAELARTPTVLGPNSASSSGEGGGSG